MLLHKMLKSYKMITHGNEDIAKPEGKGLCQPQRISIYSTYAGAWCCYLGTTRDDVYCWMWTWCVLFWELHMNYFLYTSLDGKQLHYFQFYLLRTSLCTRLSYRNINPGQLLLRWLEHLVVPSSSLVEDCQLCTSNSPPGFHVSQQLSLPFDAVKDLIIRVSLLQERLTIGFKFVMGHLGQV